MDGGEPLFENLGTARAPYLSQNGGVRPYVYREGPVLGGVVPPRLHVRDVKGVGDRLDVVGRRVSLRAEDRNEALFHHVAHCKMDGALRHTLDSRLERGWNSESNSYLFSRL